jgi:uncharacterized membrane protein
MAEQILELLERASWFINLFAVLIIVAGFALSLERYFSRYSSTELDENFARFKVELGRSLLLGLEILVLADVLESITVEPTYQTLSVLVFLVVVRTIVSWTLTLEVEGKWPWQSERKKKPETGNV